MTLSKNLTGNQPTTNSDSSSGISSDIARFATNASDTSAMDATTPSSSVNDGRSMVAREGRENQGMFGFLFKSNRTKRDKSRDASFFIPFF